MRGDLAPSSVVSSQHIIFASRNLPFLLTQKGNFDTLFERCGSRERWYRKSLGQQRLPVKAKCSIQKVFIMFFLRNPHGYFASSRAFSLIRVGVAAAALLLAACAGAPGGQSTDAYAGKSLEEQVRERATMRWQALIRGELDTAYGYFSKATRETYPIELYRAKMRPGSWREAKVESVKCAEGICDVALTLVIDHNRLRNIVTPIAERWIVQDGIAWYVYNG